MKRNRHEAILSLVEKEELGTQEELMCRLHELGYNVTQATVSRDIKEMHLIKVLSKNGGYRYATLDKAEHGMSDRFIRMFSESVLSMNSANNLIVIKTLAGSAHVAGEAIDNLKWPEILGSIAGDNTILVIVRSNEDVAGVLARFKEMIK